MPGWELILQVTTAEVKVKRLGQEKSSRKCPSCTQHLSWELLVGDCGYYFTHGTELIIKKYVHSFI